MKRSRSDKRNENRRLRRKAISLQKKRLIEAKVENERLAKQRDNDQARRKAKMKKEIAKR